MYKTEISKTGLRPWPYKIHLSGVYELDKSRHLLYEIYKWLNFPGKEIKYQYKSTNYWYFKNEEDAIAFVLKWSH